MPRVLVSKRLLGKTLEGHSNAYIHKGCTELQIRSDINTCVISLWPELLPDWQFFLLFFFFNSINLQTASPSRDFVSSKFFYLLKVISSLQTLSPQQT